MSSLVRNYASASRPHRCNRYGARSILLATWLLASMLSMQTAWSRPVCTDRDTRRAETEIDALDGLDAHTPRGSDWNAIHRFYDRFRQCDGGDIGEAFSDDFVRQFANHWNRLEQFVAISNRDAVFRKFVLRHIDATTNYDDLKKIVQSAKTLCPVKQRKLCSELTSRAQVAIREIDENPLKP